MARDHVVVQGEGISSIADENGFFPGTLWDHPRNAALRAAREDGNVLHPGDVVHVPDLRPREAAIETGRRHVFRKRGVPAKLRIQLFKDGAPRAGEPFRLEIDGKATSGVLGDDGVLHVDISPRARRGVLHVGEDERPLTLELGALDPITEVTGVQKRLHNLGFHAGSPSGVLDPATRSALLRFQRRYGLEQTGEIDAATRDLLGSLHDTDRGLDAAEPGRS